MLEKIPTGGSEVFSDRLGFVYLSDGQDGLSLKKNVSIRLVPSAMPGSPLSLASEGQNGTHARTKGRQ
jgi:hypothetical protein